MRPDSMQDHTPNAQLPAPVLRRFPRYLIHVRELKRVHQQWVSSREIAEILGITVENVKIRLHRGRKRLKALLEEHCVFEVDERNVLTCQPETTSGYNLFIKPPEISCILSPAGTP